jgi:type IV secretory pathway VirB4 component
MNPFVIESSALVASVIGLSAAGIAALPRLPVNLKEVRKSGEQGFDSLIVTEYLVAPGITCNEDGAFTTGWCLRGPDATTKTEGALDRMVGDFNAALSCTEQGWMYEHQRVRLPSKLSAIAEPETFLPSPTHRVLADVRDAVVCEDEVRLLVTYLPPGEAARTIANWLIYDTRPERARDALAEALAALEEGCRQIETTLRTCMLEVERLTISEDETHDGLFETLYKNINGWKYPAPALPPVEIGEDGLFVEPIDLRDVLAVQDFDGGMDLTYGREHIRCISVVEFPNNRQPRMLAELAALGIPHRDHSRFIVASHQEMTHELTERSNDARDDATKVQVLPNRRNARRVSEKAIAKNSLDKDALDRLKDLRKVKAAHQNGSRRHSWYSRIIELRSEDPEQLEAWTSAICETLRTAPHGGFGVRIEEEHGAEAWLSTLGGNGYNFVRRTPAHGVTVGDLANLTDSWRGRETITCDKCAPGTKPMFWARRSDTLAPFAFDLHFGDVMATVILGPIKYGKTTLTDMILANFRKEERDRVVGLDYMRSGERTAVMFGGAYGYPGEENSPARLCPFTDLRTVPGRAHAVEWCEFVLERDTGKTVPGDVKKRIVEAVDFLASDDDWEDHACVTLFSQKLSAPPAIKDAFLPYMAGGIYGHTFDATPAQMREWQRPIRIYDTTALYDLSEAAAMPALMIICADAVREVDGRRMLLVIEEAHIPLKHKLLKPWLIKLLRTTRKKHLGIIFVLTDVEGIDGDTLRVLKGLCGTVIATENPSADAWRDAYGFLGYSDAQIDSLIPSRNPSIRRDGLDPLRYKYLQSGPDGVASFVLDLSPAEMEAYARGNDDDKAITAAALAKDPELAPWFILQRRGLMDEAEAWAVYHKRHGGKGNVWIHDPREPDGMLRL